MNSVLPENRQERRVVEKQLHSAFTLIELLIVVAGVASVACSEQCERLGETIVLCLKSEAVGDRDVVVSG